MALTAFACVGCETADSPSPTHANGGVAPTVGVAGSGARRAAFDPFVSPCAPQDELVVIWQLSLPPSMLCYSHDALRDPATHPFLPGAAPGTDEDAGAPSRLAQCPLARQLEWGPVTFSCTDQPVCNQPAAPESEEADVADDAGTAPDPPCCYWVVPMCLDA
jgi:hypothetical protein